MIETFGPTHPLTQYMIFDLQLDEKSDLSVLDMGLQPYHWCPLTPKSHCLIPIATTVRESYEQLEKQKKELDQISKEKFQLEHAPYKEPHKKVYATRGRPSNMEQQQQKLKKEKQEEEGNKRTINDS